MLATALTLDGSEVPLLHVDPPSVLTMSGAEAFGPGPLATHEPSPLQSIALSVYDLLGIATESHVDPPSVVETAKAAADGSPAP